MTQKQIGHVFMSYSRIDEEVMQRVVTFLRSRGINVWVDNEKLIPGTPIWETEIEKAIFGADATVVILSPDSKASQWVRREISYTERYQKRIFPVLVRGDENSSISIRLTNHQYVDIRDNEEMGLEKLSTALSFYLEDMETQKQEMLKEGKNVQFEKEKRPTESPPPQPPVVRAKNNDRTDEEELKIDRRHPARWLSILWIALGWAIGVSFGFHQFPNLGAIIKGAMIGMIGGFFTGISMRLEHILHQWKGVWGITMSWGVGWVIGWSLIGVPVGGVFGGAIGGAIGGLGTAFFLWVEKIIPNWKNVLIVTLGWSIGWTTGEFLIRQQAAVDPSIVVGTLIGVIGGFVTIWRIRSMDRSAAG